MVSWVLHLKSALYDDSWKFLICVFVQLKPCHVLCSLISSCVLHGGRPRATLSNSFAAESPPVLQSPERMSKPTLSQFPWLAWHRNSKCTCWLFFFFLCSFFQGEIHRIGGTEMSICRAVLLYLKFYFKVWFLLAAVVGSLTNPRLSRS